MLTKLNDTISFRLLPLLSALFIAVGMPLLHSALHSHSENHHIISEHCDGNISVFADEDHESDKHETHSEFRAEYHFLCKKPEKLAYIDVMLFNVFSGIEHIEVQLLTVNKKTALELTAKKKKIMF